MSTKDLYTISSLPKAKSKQAILDGGFVEPGDLINVALQLDNAVHFVTVLAIEHGQSKGNHFHREKVETITIVKGEVTVKLKAINEGELIAEKLRIGDSITIRPGCAHALIAENGDMQFLEVSNNKYDPDDVYPYRFE